MFVQLQALQTTGYTVYLHNICTTSQQTAVFAKDKKGQSKQPVASEKCLSNEQATSVILLDSICAYQLQVVIAKSTLISLQLKR